MCIISENLLLTHGHQIHIISTHDACTPTDRFTSGLTYFSRSHGSKCENQILGQPEWHKS